MTFTTTGCAATELYYFNDNGTLGSISPSSGTYTMLSTGIGTISFTNGDFWQIVVDSPSATTTGEETEVRILGSAPSGTTTNNLILVGTCKAQ
jgi:hypothetical protein